MIEKPTQRSPEAMRAAILALTDKLLAGLEAKAGKSPFGGSEINLLGRLSAIVNQHCSGVDPLAQREGETIEQYRARLESFGS